MKQEIWKPVVGYEGLYEVSNFGRICHIYKNERRILKGCKDKDGYLGATFINGKEYKRLKIHRVVAQAFIPNPNKYPCVNHKDEIKSNNKVDNLEWCTHRYNNTYGTLPARTRYYATYLSPKLRKVIQLDMDMNILEIHISSRMAERATGIKHQNIIAVCRGQQSTAGGYIWRYAE